MDRTAIPTVELVIDAGTWPGISGEIDKYELYSTVVCPVTLSRPVPATGRHSPHSSDITLHKWHGVADVDFALRLATHIGDLRRLAQVEVAGLSAIRLGN